MIAGNLHMKIMIDLRIGLDVNQERHQMSDFQTLYLHVLGVSFLENLLFIFVWLEDPKVHFIIEAGNIKTRTKCIFFHDVLNTNP